MRIFFSYLQQQWRLVLLSLLLGSINHVFSFLDPYFYRLIIDKYAMKAHEYNSETFFKGVLLLLAAIVCVAMVSRIAKNLQDYFVNVVVQKASTAIYTDGVKHALQLPFQVFEDQRSGETLGILQKVRTDTERLILSFVNVIFASFIAIVFVVSYSISIYWLIAPIYTATIPIVVLVSYFLSANVKKVQQKIVRETASLAGTTTESLRNIELVKALGLADQEVKRLNRITRRILNLELEKIKYIRTLGFVQGTCINLVRTTISLLMLYLIFKNKITVGEFFSLFMYSFYVFGPLQEIGSFISIWRETEVSFQNFEHITNQPVESVPSNPTPLTRLEKLYFNNVSFQYPTSTHTALSDINFSVNSGQTVAFVGPSGSGKTTLIKLLVGLYAPAKGQIYYNDTPQSSININQLREQLGLVSQETQLFSGSLRENLLFVKPDTTDPAMMRVLMQSACHSLLNRAEKGLDSIIGEGGIMVSGGEKQRISIARALLRQPTLLVFDEATSALDSITEEEIAETIRDINTNKNHIILIVAHRLSTVMHADTIYVLEKGQIVEQGTHYQLLSQGGLYAAMWRQQVGEKYIDEDVFHVG